MDILYDNYIFKIKKFEKLKNLNIYMIEVKDYCFLSVPEINNMMIDILEFNEKDLSSQNLLLVFENFTSDDEMFGGNIVFRSGETLQHFVSDFYDIIRLRKIKKFNLKVLLYKEYYNVDNYDEIMNQV